MLKNTPQRLMHHVEMPKDQELDGLGVFARQAQAFGGFDSDPSAHDAVVFRKPLAQVM